MGNVTPTVTGFTALMIACTLTVSAQRGPSVPPLVKEGITEKISDHVYVIPDQSVPVVPNVGIIVGSCGTFVIDTGLGARNGQAIMREVGKVSRNNDLYLATTHFHPEHDLGAQGFPPTTKMLRSKDQQADIDEFGLEMAKTFSGFSPLNAELLQGAEFRKADTHFDKEHTVDLGGVTDGGEADACAGISQFKRHFSENEVELGREMSVTLMPAPAFALDLWARARRPSAQASSWGNEMRARNRSRDSVGETQTRRRS